jgi:transmembrane sensor
MNEEQARQLLKRYLAGEATPSEQALVEAWYARLEAEGKWGWEPGEKEAMQAMIENRLLGAIRGEDVTQGRVIPLRRWRRLAVAAVLVLVGCGAYLLYSRAPAVTVASVTHDLPPGGNKAVLTLANGSQILLDSAANGTLAQQGSVNVMKTDSGRLAYTASNEKPNTVLYNTLKTPRGGQYQLVLPDGSKVWLNAASSIRYPVLFSGPDREVEVSGEAYFEVAKSATNPFRVKIGDKAVIEVLGTEFNVNAYEDEPAVRTTLLQGSVKVLSAGGGNAPVLLAPGQQAALFAGNPIKLLSGVDVNQVVAWKNGLFSFDKADLPTVLRQLARWYDFDVVYEGDVKPRHFGGKIERDLNLSEVLGVLQQTKVHFIIENRKLKVKP